MKYSKTPIIELKNKLTVDSGVSLLIKREDQNHPHVSGNKWWKLKYNLKHASEKGYTTLLTFGGAYSNHLYATAAAANEMGFRSIGIVRGEETLPLNGTLTFAKEKGMHLNYISRRDYKGKNDPQFMKSLQEEYGSFYLIPEGGTNELAIEGCKEWAHQLRNEIDFNYLCLPVGTGGTMAGMVSELKDKEIIGFSSLKGGDFLEEEIKAWLKTQTVNWKIETQYHFGGYGKINQKLKNFMKEFETENDIPLDPVYTAKMIFGIYDLLKHNAFKPGSRILMLHTGGLQGRYGLNF